MTRSIRAHRRSLLLGGVLLPLLGIFANVTFRSGPFAPVPVTVATVEIREISPALFGIGTVEARYIHKLGPTFSARLRSVDVEPGDRVTPGQLLGEMDPIDLDEKIVAQDATIKRAEATVAACEAQIEELAAREHFAAAQAKRYEQIAAAAVSAGDVDSSKMALRVAQTASLAAGANREVAVHDLARLRAERDGLLRQRASLRLYSPVEGLVTRRDADIGTTVTAGQSVVEVVEPGSIWIHARFDQQLAAGLRGQLAAEVRLRSLGDAPLAGHVLRVEPLADDVTEELLARIAFDEIPEKLPPIGELAEVTVALEPLRPMPALPLASIHRVNGCLGVWVVRNGGLRFAAVKTGASDLDGWVQLLDGLQVGERVVVYSKRALNEKSRIEIVDRLLDTPQ